MPTAREDYLARMTEADEKARSFPEGSFERESWLKIADAYRVLLMHAWATDEGKAKP